MVIDTSAVLAMMQDEPEAEAFRIALDDDRTRLMSAATVLEASMALDRAFGEIASRELDFFINQAGIEIVPVDKEQLMEARKAWRRFGRGRHPARLNYGDLFSYALSRTTGEPLLYKGDDFSRTDVARVM